MRADESTSGWSKLPVREKTSTGPVGPAGPQSAPDEPERKRTPTAKNWGSQATPQWILDAHNEKQAGGQGNSDERVSHNAFGQPGAVDNPLGKEREPYLIPEHDKLYGFEDGQKLNTRVMTDEEYRALTPAQQSAVDFNTMLTEAVRKDLKEWAGKKAPVGYDEKARKVFLGSAYKIDRYAPNTVNLLESMGYSTNQSRLDDFLELKTVITDDDLSLMNIKSTEEEADRSMHMPADYDYRAPFQRELVNKFDTSLIAEDSAARMSALRAQLLGTPNLPGFGGGELDEKFRIGFEMLSRDGAAKDYSENKKRIAQSLGGSKELMAQFLQYAEARSREAHLKNQPLGDQHPTYYTPEQFRKIYRLGGAE